MKTLPAILCALAAAAMIPVAPAAMPDEAREQAAHALLSAQAYIRQTDAALAEANAKLAAAETQAAEQAADATRNAASARQWEAQARADRRRADAAELSRGHWRARALWTWAGLGTAVAGYVAFRFYGASLTAALRGLKPV